MALRSLYMGRRQFEAFRRYTGASKATLRRRLSALVEQGVMVKRSISPLSTRQEYCLSAKGAGLFPVSLVAGRWEHEWLGDVSNSSPKNLIPRCCQLSIVSQAVCGDGELPFRLTRFGFRPWRYRVLSTLKKLNS
ncbi:winged helix-turn-helix transcriptional regulator [Zhongshania sp.]|uniref:winged helix-turn-helix transcriptional regulator n=1 Tax=Zhongshania sp. TaxID=1971902 RepID=UPI00356790F0